MDFFIFTKEILRRKFSFRAMTDTVLVVAHRKSCKFLRNLRNILLKQHLFFRLSARLFYNRFFGATFFGLRLLKQWKLLSLLS